MRVLLVLAMIPLLAACSVFSSSEPPATLADTPPTETVVGATDSTFNAAVNKMQQDGVKVFDPTGKPIGFIALPERCANVCFGTAKRNRLFMAASHSLYSLYVNTQGAV